MTKVRDECGIILTHDFDDLYRGLTKLQNRGKETAGVAVKDGSRIDVITWTGKVRRFGDKYLSKLLNVDDLNNPIFMGHVRYSTSGDKKDVRNAHPRFLGGAVENRGDHLIARRVRAAVVHNGTLINHPDIGTVDSDTDLLLTLYENMGAEGIMGNVPAAYSSIIMDSKDDEVKVLRDRYGFRPLSIGEKKGKKIVASESRSISSFGGVFREDLPRGSIAYITGNKMRLKHLADAPSRFCFFEINYLLHWKSSIMGHNIANIRERLGRQVAKKFHPSDVTIVTYTPECPYSMAMGYAEEIGTEKREVFYKIDDDRSFLGGEAEERSDAIKRNLHIRDDVDLKGEVILVIDDSIIRGNVIKRAVNLLRERGAAKVYYVSVTPPVGPIVDDVKRGCLYGVDMPPEPDSKNEFVWRIGNQTVEGVRDVSGADEVYYLDKEDMFEAYNIPVKDFCTYCIGGPDPLK